MVTERQAENELTPALYITVYNHVPRGVYVRLVPMGFDDRIFATDAVVLPGATSLVSQPPAWV